MGLIIGLDGSSKSSKVTIVNSVPTDISKDSSGKTYIVPNSDGTTFTTYVVVDNNGTKTLLKDEGTTTQVIDELTSTSASAALSANQGRILNEYIQDNEKVAAAAFNEIYTNIGDVETLLSKI